MSFYFAYESAILLEDVPVNIQGRMFAMKGMLTQILTPIGYFLGAIMADYLFEPFMKTDNILRKACIANRS